MMAVWALALGCVGLVRGTTYYVDGRATGANDGSSWADAFTDLQTALDVAIAEDQIRVAWGIYRPGPAGGDRTLSFFIDAPIVLLGGFAGLGAADPDARDVMANQTILSGDLNGDDRVEMCLEDLPGEPTRQDNAYRVVVFGAHSGRSVLDGFVITGGNANGSDWHYSYGGGILGDEYQADPLIRFCTIELNTSVQTGGGAYVQGRFEDCLVRFNYSVGYGGGLAGIREVTRCVIEANGCGQYGGGLEVWSARIADSIIQNNTAATGGGIYAGPAGIEMTGCTVQNNIAFEDGGGVYVSNCGTCNGFPVLYRCRIIGNTAGRDGGGFYESPSEGWLWSCLIAGNAAVGNGGGIYEGTDGYCGIINCTVFANSANDGGGMFYQNAYGGIEGIIRSGIFWGNTDGTGTGTERAQIHLVGQYSTGHVPDDGPLSAMACSCCIQGLTLAYTGSGNISSDPRFVDGYGDDDRPGTRDDNLRLLEDSPCIDTGDNGIYSCVFGGPGTGTGISSPPGTGFGTFPGEEGYFMCNLALLDLDAKGRIRGGRVDMGAYESPVKPGTVVYVDDSATGSSDGTCWGDAFTDLQDALAISTPGHEIHIAQGLYLPDDPNGNREATFSLKNGVKIRGGYAGFGADDPDARDVSHYRSILSGDLGQSMPTLNADTFYDKLVIRARDEYTNSFHVVSAVGVDATAVLDGFVITGGTANGFVYGESADPKYYHGGGVYVESASPTLIACTITGNIAFVYGGPAAKGGGMYCINGNPNLIRCSFMQNVADDYDSDAYGAGIYVEDGGPRLIGCVFERNTTLNWGGAMAFRGFSSPTLDQCRFIGNFGQYGGGAIWATLQDIQILTARNCVFAGNSAGGEGGGVALRGGNADIRNCTFTSNQHYALALEAWNTAEVFISNCIFRDGGFEILRSYGNPYLRVWNTDIEGGWSGYGNGNLDVDPLFAAPGHWDDNGTPDQNYDDIWTDGDYHLKSQAGRWDPVGNAWVPDSVTSPCIDAGDPASPIMVEPFPNGGVINMGAYGGTAEASKSYFGGPVCEVIVAGDINGDCAVNLADFAILAGHWLQVY